MAAWGEPLIFGLFLLAFTYGLSNVILAFLPTKDEQLVRTQVEYGFFGAAGLIVSLVFVYALM